MLKKHFSYSLYCPVLHHGPVFMTLQPFGLQSAHPLVVFCSCFPSQIGVTALSRLGHIRFR